MANEVIALDKSSLDNTVSFVEADNIYVADNGLTKTEFRPVGNKVSFQNKGYTIDWTPRSMKYLDENGFEDTIYSVQDAPLEVKGNKVRFNRSMPDVDDMFIVDGDRLKHSIMVQGWQRDPAFYMSGNIDFVISGELAFDSSLSVHAHGLNITGPFETGDSIEIRNGDEIIFTLPKIVAYDSNIPERAEAFGKYRVTSNENGVLAFDIVMDNAWMADGERVYPILIDPTVVVSSAYDTSGNGGRKIVVLSNGWIVTSAFWSVTQYLYVSKDNGQTWTSLCRCTISYPGVAVAAKGTFVYLLYMPGASSMAVSYFDAVTVANIDISTTKYTLASNLTAYGNAATMVINSIGSEVHCSWSDKTSTLPSSLNIRYIKGTISSDGSVTWGSVTQVSRYDSTNGDCINPSITIRSNNLPTITFAQVNVIYSNSFNGSSWQDDMYGYGRGKVVYDGNPYTQFAPTSIVKNYGSNIGRIYVGWNALDSIDATKQNIRIAYSDDGGSTWALIGKITSGNTVDRKNVVLAEAINGDFYAFYEDNGNIVYQKCANGTTTFSGLTIIATGTNPAIMDQEKNSIIGFIWKDATSVKFDKLSFNQAPTAPTNLSPNGTTVDRALVQRLSWQHNDPNAGDGQSKFDLQWRQVGSGTWNTVTQTTPNQYWDAPANTFPNVNIQWQVRTYDQANVVGPYSSQAAFLAGIKPVTPTIIEPSTTIATARPNISWSSSGQVSYQVQVLDGAAVVWDTSEVVSGDKVVTCGIDLTNSKTYTFKVRIKNADGLWSDYASVSRAVSFTPPATPTLTITNDSTNAKITVKVNNPTPSGSQPTIAFNDIYRRVVGEASFTRIATGIANNGTYIDYAAADGISYEYKARANGNNGTYSDSSNYAASILFTGVWLHDVANPAGTINQYKYDGQSRGREWQAEASMMQFAGRKLPVAEFGESGNGKVNVQLQILNGQADLDKLRSLVYGKGTICYRDGRGRKVFGVITQLPEVDELFGTTVTLELQETSYSEVV